MSDLPPNEIPIAVVGLGCRFPGADSLDDYWQLIRQGRSGIVELPPDKIDLDLYYDPEPGKLGRSYTKLGGVVAERPLDPAICRLPEKLLHNADPAHLIMCEVAAMAFRHAGYDPDNIPTPQAGVYIGHSGGSVLAGEMACHNYAETVVPYLLEDPTFRALPAATQQTVLRGVIDRVHRSTRGRRADGGPEIGASNVSALISQAFGLSGPALATDAACASSLIAMAMGIHALRHGQIDMAVVGGASCSKWYALVLFSQAKSISGTGSRPFDANADGLISSDGYAAVVLKTLPRALKDGDPIQAIIRGIGVSSDGRGKSLWAPRKEGQILAVHRAYGRGIDPAWLQYIECHATSTQVGDSTELGALNLALKDKLPRDRKLPIGSVKANIGHTLESAGIAGFCKAVLSMRHRTIPGQIHFQTPNPDVPWNDIPFYVPTESQPWPEPLPGRPRRTAVNAFGIGGLNVHVVLDDQLTEATKTQVVVPANPATGADDEAIAIIGASAIFPGALTLAAFWDLLASGRDPKREVPADRWSKELYYAPQAEGPRRVANALGGFITDFVYDWKKHKVPPKQMANANPLQFMLLDAADQALRDSGYDQKAFDKQRAAVIVGSVYGGDFACEMQMGLRIPEFQKHIRDELRARGVPAAQVEAVATAYQDLLLRHMPALQDETGSFTASTLASRLTKTFDLMGGAFSIDAHDVSSLASIGAAVGMLQDRAVDMVLCAAGQRSMDINVYEGFQLRKVLAKGRPQPAFTEQADGVVPGEGVGVLILKRLADAQRDGDTIRAVIRGVGAAVRLDAQETGYAEAVTRALEHANVPATAISVVESASIGLSAVDQAEATALAKVLPGAARAVPAILSSVTPQIGHTLGVSGMAAVLKATVELEHGQVPATPGMTRPLSAVTTQPDALRVATEARPLKGTLPQGKTAAVVTNSAANGAVYALVLEGGTGLPSAPVPTTKPRVDVVTPDVRSERKAIRLAAAQRTDLSGLCRQQTAHAAALFASGGAPFTGGEGVRLTILADSAEGLERQLHFTADHLQRSSNTFLLDDKAIFVQDGRLPGKTAFLFPGQGSQYAGMLRPLIDEVPAAKSILAEIDATLRQTGCPTFAEMAWDQPERLGSDVFLTQLAMLVSSVLSYRVLESQGLRPDVVSCHSYGEFSALVAIGVLSLRDAILATRERTRSVETRESTKGVLLSTTAPLELVEQVLGSSPGGAYLASHNAPDQCVMGGTADAVQGVKRLLEAEGFATRALAVPRPYHTPLLAEAQGPFAAALAGITFADPKCPLISSVSLKPVTTGAEARRNLVDQLVTPVRYVQLVEQLLTSGVTTLIEVGPNRVLTRLNQRILPGKPVTILPMDVPQHPGREGLIRIQTVLASAPKATQGTSQESPLASRPRHEILFFDATQHRRGGRPATIVSTVSTPAPVVAPVVESPPPVVVGPTLDRAAVTRFMIRYVVDQTGYPEEMVELTADLEADLGIDSIKKAQLIGELAENFELTHLAGSLSELSLDDFRTLDAILTFVMAGPQTTTISTPSAEPVAVPAVVTSPVPSVTTPLAPTAESPAIPPAEGPWDHLPEAFSVVTLAGSDYEIGRQHGQSQAPQIRAIMERYAAMLGPRLQNIPELDAALANPTMYFGEAEIEELKGIADGAGLPHGAVLAHNLGMYPDYVPGCTQFAFTKQVNPRYGLVHAVNEDSPLSLTLPDCLSRIVQIRRPTHGLAHVTFSVSGQSGGLNGINEAGLAITSTLLLDCPRRKETAIGKVHPVLVKRLLERAESIEAAVKLLRTLDRAGAWSLCLSEFRTDRLCYLEYDGDHLEVQEHPKRVLTTNHCLLQTPVADVPEHSRHRLARLQQLLAVADRDGVPLELAQQTLRDRYDLGRGRQTPHATMNTIRRVDNQISIVMRPEHGEIYVTPGPRSGEIIDTYYKLEIGDLFRSRSTASTEQQADALATSIRATTHASSTAVQVAGNNGKHHSPASTATEKSGSVKFTTKPFIGDPRTGLPPEGKRVVQRHVLRMEAAPLPAGTPERPSFQGPVLLLGRNKLTEALRERLQGWGHTCHVLPAEDAAVAALELLWAKEPALQLIVTTARDGDAATIDRGDWAARSNTGVLVPFLVCQKWAQLVQAAGRTGDATLIAVTALGGDFGIGGRVHSFEGGGLTGLLKGLRRELSEMAVKVIDAPLEEAPEGLAKVVLQEAAHREGPLEVGSIRGRRFVVRAVPQPASAQRPGTKTPHGVWVVTGGARGVTAVVARELGRRFGLKMHLLGSTAEPAIDPSWRNLTEEGLKTLKRSIMDQARAAGKHPAGTWKEVERAIEIDRTLQAFRADGIAVTYHACDVSDRAPLAATLDRIRKQDGPISGVIHGAGLEAACRFDKKKRDLVAATLGVKVDAAVHLAALTADDPLEYFLGFGSTSGRFGGMGQCDYSMASDMLCKLCAAWRQARPNVAAIGLHWPPWADVGMAARPESKIALQSSNLAFMPPLEGAAHVIDELLGRAIEGELLFLDKPDLIDTDGTMPDAALKAEYLRRDPQVQRASLVETIHGLKPGSGLIATLELDPTSDPFLLEHRHQGQPILPAVVGMESFAETASILAADGRKLIGLRDMTVHQGLRFLNERTQRAKVVLEHGAAGLHARLVADFQDRQGRLVEADRLQMEATLELAADYSPLPDAELGPVPTSWTTHRYVVDWRTMKFPEEARVYHGVPFQALRDYALVDGGLWARLIVPPPALIAGDRSAAGWQLPSATIDAGLLGADLLVWHTLHVADLPQSFGRIRLARPLVPGEALTLRVWLRGRSDRRIDADFVMVDAAGRVVIQVDGYHMVEVKTGTNGGAPVAPPTSSAGPAKIMPATSSGPAPAPIPGAIKPKTPSLVLPTSGPTPAPAPLPGTQPFNGAMPPVTTPQGNITTGMTLPAIAAERIAELPLIDTAMLESPDKLVTTTRFDPTNDPFLDEHRFSGKPLLPAVIGLETMIEAVSLTAPAGRDFVVRSFRILAPCKFVDHTPQTLRVVAERQGDGWACQLVGTTGKPTVYQTAVIAFPDQLTAAEVPAFVKPSFPFSPMQYANGKQAQLIHGPRFQCLKGLSLQREWGWGRVIAAAADNLAGSRPGRRWFLPVATLDSCLVACGVDLFILMNMRVEVPHGIEELRIVRLPNADETCTVRLKFGGSDDRHTKYDLFLYGAQGDLLLAARGYQGIRTSKGADSALWDGDFSNLT